MLSEHHIHSTEVACLRTWPQLPFSSRYMYRTPLPPPPTLHSFSFLFSSSCFFFFLFLFSFFLSCLVVIFVLFLFFMHTPNSNMCRPQNDEFGHLISYEGERRIKLPLISNSTSRNKELTHMNLCLEEISFNALLN